MTISARFLDHTGTIYGSTDSRGAGFGDVTRRYTQVPGMVDVPLALQQRFERRDDPGGGQRPTGEWKSGGSASLDVEVGDVIDYTAGPNAPICLRVDAREKPGGRHTELVMVTFDGELG